MAPVVRLEIKRAALVIGDEGVVGVAAALIFGFARKSTYIAAAVFSLLIWSTAEGFGGPYTAGSTDVGASTSTS
jgi:hypothetical protein